MKTVSTNFFLVSLVSLLFYLFPTITYGQTPCSDYTVDPIPYAPIAGTGTSVSLLDDAISAPLPIGFSFNFYCNTYTDFVISSNGFISFDTLSGHGCCMPDTLPDANGSNNLIALAWDDLNPSLGGSIEYFTTGIAPNRRLVVQYDSIMLFGSTTAVTVQLVLHEGTSIIDIHSISINSNPNDQITQGIENSDGTLGLAVPGRNSTFWSSTAESYRFKLRSKIYGLVYQDFNQNCTIDSNDLGLRNRNLIITPGNFVVQTSSNGFWGIDSLPIGTYNITIDTTGPWLATCPITQTFTVIHPDSMLIVPPFGLFSTAPCPSPRVSINAPFLRPGFSNQLVNVQACNDNLATTTLDSAYTLIELDSLLTIQNSSLPYTSLGNNLYRVNLGTIAPGACVNFWLACKLDSTAMLGQSICMNALMLPIDSCHLDYTPAPYLSTNVSPCNTDPWDNSNVEIDAWCDNDSTYFLIYNTGQPVTGDMDCYAPVRLYIDGQFVLLDSIQLVGGDSILFVFDGNGQTLRLEVDQHPLHPGLSSPSAAIEMCGNIANWTPNLINTLPHDDANPFVDIFCGIVRGSYDPNDKRGFPLGTGNDNDILPNQNLEYIIRFQNTGTDTAFTVVIRDTLTTELDILSVRSGVSSHNYEFKMDGRVLEWTFNNIMLPDSNVNEPLSNGFVTFTVDQTPNLPNGTLLENSAGIYFDFNAPIITNTSSHTINDGVIFLDMTEVITKEMALKVYPNPTRDYITIELNEEKAATITLVNNLGQVILSKPSTGKNTSIQLQQLPAGIYYLSVYDGAQTAVQKIIKQ